MSDYLQSFLDRYRAAPSGGSGGLDPCHGGHVTTPSGGFGGSSYSHGNRETGSHKRLDSDPPKPPEPDAGPDPEFSVCEVAGLPARHIFALPLPTSLVLRVTGLDGHVTVGAGPRAAFKPAEWLMLVQLAECGRADPRSMRRWCNAKRKQPAFQLPESGPSPREASDWTVGAVLDCLGAKLRAVAINSGEQA